MNIHGALSTAIVWNCCLDENFSLWYFSPDTQPACSTAKQKYQTPSSASSYQEPSASQAIDPAIAAFQKQPPASTQSLAHFS